MYRSELDPAGPTGESGTVAESVTLAALAEPPISLDAPRTNRGFLTELAQAMQAAAELERARLSAEMDGVAQTHVEKVRTRGAAEAEELRRLADADVTGIHTWTKAETARIREEAERRIGDRRRELDDHLVRHTALIDGEVGHIDGAVDGYRQELDAFFDRLSAETDPGEFARLADDLPEPPDLAKVGGAARAEAVAALALEEDPPESIDRGASGDDRPANEDSGPHQLGAFDPGARGPELVPVMDEASPTDEVAAEAPAADAAPAAADAPAAETPVVPEGAVAAVRMPIETVIPPASGSMATPPAVAVPAAASTTPVAAATEAAMRFLRSFAVRADHDSRPVTPPRPVTQPATPHKD